MPLKPKRLCPKCSNIVQGPCDKCNKQREQQYDKARQYTNSRPEYRTNRWKEYSEAFRHQHPCCADCEARGLVVATEVVGHIKPAWKFPELFWEPSNHTPQCVACNKRQEMRDAKEYRA